MIKKVEVVAASKKYLAFTQDDPSAIYESFMPSVLKVMWLSCDQRDLYAFWQVMWMGYALKL